QLAAANQNGEKSNIDRTSQQQYEQRTNAQRARIDSKPDDGGTADRKNDPQSKDASQAKSQQKEQSQQGEQKKKDNATSAQAQNKESQDGEWREQPKQKQGKAPT